MSSESSAFGGARRARAIGLSLVGMAGICSGMVQAATPSTRFDLSHWKLTLPVDSNGGTTGTAMDVSAANLLGGYSSKWFYVGSDGGVVFYVPAVGAKTVNASSPRSELREEITPPSDSVNWYTTNTSYLDATVTVNKLPASTNKMVIGQIHGYNAPPLVKLKFFRSKSGDCSVVGEVTASPNGAPQYVNYTLAGSVALNKQFTYNVSLVGGVLKMSINGGPVTKVAIDSVWASSGLYFKAGAYPYSSGATGDDARVTMYSVLVTHK